MSWAVRQHVLCHHFERVVGAGGFGYSDSRPFRDAASCAASEAAPGSCKTFSGGRCLGVTMPASTCTANLLIIP